VALEAPSRVAGNNARACVSVCVLRGVDEVWADTKLAFKLEEANAKFAI